MVITGHMGRHWTYAILSNHFFFLEPPVIVPFSFGSSVVNTGVYAQLTCVVSQGDMPVTITWSLKGKELNSGPSIQTTQLGQQASILVISSVDYTHIGEYTCRATNPAGSVTHSAELRVNGKIFGTWEGTGIIFCI